MLKVVLDYHLDWIALCAIVVNAMALACAFLHRRPNPKRMPRFAWLLVVLILISAAWGAQLAANPIDPDMTMALARADALAAFWVLAFIVIGFTTVLTAAGDETSTVSESPSGLFEILLDYAADCVQVLTPDGVIRQVNPAGMELFEATASEELVGQPLLARIADGQQETFNGMFQSVARGHAASLQIDIVTCKGNTRHLELRAIPLRPVGGEVTAILAIERDQTALRQAQAERDRLQQELLALADELAGIVAGEHDTTVEELSHLSRNVEQIKQSIASQRSVTPADLQEVG